MIVTRIRSYLHFCKQVHQRKISSKIENMYGGQLVTVRLIKFVVLQNEH